MISRYKDIYNISLLLYTTVEISEGRKGEDERNFYPYPEYEYYGGLLYRGSDPDTVSAAEAA